MKLQINGNLSRDAVEIAEALNHYCIDSVATIAQFLCDSHRHYSIGYCTLAATISFLGCCRPSFHIRNIREADVLRIINLKTSEAKDVYEMNANMLKDLSTSLVSPLTKILNQSVSQRVWESPIFKSGNLPTACNYRPVSILPAVLKMAERWVAEQLAFHLNSSTFSLHPKQFRFRAKHSTEMTKCFFIEKVKSLLDEGGVVVTVFFDLRKAFDTVNHAVILSKLSTFIFSPDALRWIVLPYWPISNCQSR